MSINIQTQQQIKIDNQEFNLDKVNETLWASQSQIAMLFDTTKQNISLHIQNIIESKEIEENSAVKDFLTTASDGKNYNTKFYNLDVIIAIGYRVNSKKGTDFRIKATKILKEYLTTGQVIKKEYTRLEMAEMWYEAEKANARLLIENQQKQSIIEDFITIDENKNYTEVAKLLHKKPREFINMLKSEKYIRLNREPYQKHIDSNYFVIKYKKGIRREEDGRCIEIEDKSFPAYLITPKGFEYFVKKLK